jgi:Ca-activated chloride channel family protein
MFRFADPYFLILLAVLPAAIVYRRRKRVHPVMGLPDLTVVKGIRPSLAMVLGWLLPVCKYGVLALMIVALARPQWGTHQQNILTEGINIVLTLDLSESMGAIDFKHEKKVINRLEAVKVVVRDFIDKRTGDRIGMVVFGTEAYTQIPLTRDYQTINAILKELKIGAAGKKTAMGDALGIALKRLKDIESKSNVVILLTDGQSNAGEIEPLVAGDLARDHKVKVYTIGVGSRGKAPFIQKHPIWGQRKVYRRVSIDENTLKKIAEKTGGLYFRAENTQGLQQIYDRINQLEKTKVEIKQYTEYSEYYPYLLIPAFILLGFWVFFANTRFLRVP